MWYVAQYDLISSHTSLSFSFSEVPLDVLEHLLRTPGGVDLHHHILLAVVLYDGHGGLLVGDEPLLQRLRVVVRSARPGGAPSKAPLYTGVLVTSIKKIEITRI